MSLESTTHGEALAVTNGRVVTPSQVITDGSVCIRDGRITDVGAGTVRVSTTVDAKGSLVIPGLIDIHGDEYERYLYPRAEARVDTRTALAACDRANIAAGITTKFHAVAFEDLPDDNRSLALAEEVVEVLGSMAGLLADNRVNARCELGAPAAIRSVSARTDRDRVGMVSLMHHVPARGQFDDEEQFDLRYADRGDGIGDRSIETMDRRRLSDADLEARVHDIMQSAQSADVVVASHDDTDERLLASMSDLGVSISEYPVTLAAAQCASELGMYTAMGAPNYVRAGSLWGNLSAREAIEADILDVLCSDYHPPSLLASVLEPSNSPLVERVKRVTQAPADAVGLDDRGRLESGARGDLVVVEPSRPPRVRSVVVGGTEVYRVTDGT